MNENEYKPKEELYSDAYLGPKEQYLTKLKYLSRLAQHEIWDFSDTNDFRILRNYISYTYERVKEEDKISIAADKSSMCFNTGLLTKYEKDIFALFYPNKNENRRPGQDWYLFGFKIKSDREMSVFDSFPDVANYFIRAEDFILQKGWDICIDDEHIFEDNKDRFEAIGLDDEKLVVAYMNEAVRKIYERAKRNYKIAMPQYYTNRSGESKIQLLLPLYLANLEKPELALVVDKRNADYIGKTVLPLDWAYMNSRRILKPDVDWLRLE